MRRVLVMGCSGSGKTTFGESLARRLGVPLVTLDRLFWQPGWQESKPEEFAARVTEAAQEPAWIIDGNYMRHGAWSLRRERADTVIWFDLPRWKCMAGVLHRIATTYGTVRPDMGPGCPEKIDWVFLRYVWTFNRLQRPKLATGFAELRSDQRLLTFTSRAEAGAFLASVKPA